MKKNKLSLDDFDSVDYSELLKVKGGTNPYTGTCQDSNIETIVGGLFNQLSKLLFGPGGGSLFSTWVAHSPNTPTDHTQMSIEDVNWNMHQWANYIDQAAQVEFQTNGPTQLASDLSNAAKHCKEVSWIN